MTASTYHRIVKRVNIILCEQVNLLHSTIGERLKRIMAERCLSAAQLAKTAEVKPSFIYDIIHGKSTNPSIVKLAHIAHALHVDISALIGEDTEHIRSPHHESYGKRRRLQLDMPYREGDGYVTISSILSETPDKDGAFATSTSPEKPYYFHKAWIKEKFGVSANDLRMLFVRGDSMEPTLCAGDIVLIDITKKSPTPPGIFTLFDGFGFVLKRLEFISNTNPPAIRIISDNLQYSAYKRVIDDLHIIGRVVWFAREL
jgi:transcriptional regulator with XRE-family HTH domain